MDVNLLGAKLVSGLFAFTATGLSLHESAMHLQHFSKPELQVRIVRILGMVPIYSLTSWLSLCVASEEVRLRLDFIRDCYEAFVIYSFISLLIRLGGGWRRTIFFLEDQPRAPHFFPVNLFLPPIQLGQTFLVFARAAALQFVIVKPANGLLLLMSNGHPLFGIIPISTVKTFVAVTNNLSISAALYSLVMLHTALEDLLWKYRPLPKFLAVKMVVFFSFWQGVVLNILVRIDVIQDVEGFTASDQVTGIQDMLICIEMVVAAICHKFVFSWREWQDPYEMSPPDHRSMLSKVFKVIDVRDFFTDWRDTLSGDGYEYEMRQNEPRFLIQSAKGPMYT
mmetsp:Transcript_437/g.1495  ORF Transcript_437/g.1495 Transcript_437/m.1495 type:complete len:337 (-) Transcript_437:151-1161(-)